jgi:hypothetical protein
MRCPNRVILILATLLLIGCSCRDSKLGDDPAKWKEWAESVADGLWEGDTSKWITFTLVNSFGGEENDAILYQPIDIVLDGDTLFASDATSQQVICFTLDNSILWRSGTSGEGPGQFSRLGNIAVSESYVAVCNRGVGRVDLLDRFSGEYINSIPILWPYDVSINADTIIVASVAAQSPISIFLASGELIAEMGADFWESENVFGELSQFGNANLSIDYANGNVVLASYFQKSAVIYNIRTGEMVARLEHSLPLNRPAPSSNGSGAVTLPVHMIDCAIHNDIVYIVNGSYGREGSLPCEENGIANITIIDRYSFAGRFLDSVVLPDQVDIISMDAEYIVASNIYSQNIVWVFSMSNVVE